MPQTKKGNYKKTSAAQPSAKKKSGRGKSYAAPAAAPEASGEREIAAVIFAFLAVFVVISYFNNEGSFIVFFTTYAKGIIGWGFWLIAPVFMIVAVILGLHRDRPAALRVTCVLLIPIIFAAIVHLILFGKTLSDFEFAETAGLLFERGQALKSGGVLGGLIAIGLETAFSIYGALPILLVCFLFVIVAGLNISISRSEGKEPKKEKHTKEIPTSKFETVPSVQRSLASLPVKQNKKTEHLSRKTYPIDLPLGDDDEDLPLNEIRSTIDDILSSQAQTAQAGAMTRAGKASPVKPEKTEPAPISDRTENISDSGFRDVEIPKRSRLKRVSASAEISDPPKNKKVVRAEIDSEAQAMSEAISAAQDSGSGYVFPPLNLLRSGSSLLSDSREEILINRERLEGAIRSFGINAGIVGVTHGPTVTRYDIELEQGVKLARVTNLAGDLALALGVINVRIAPIPDKISTVGIEVPNKIVSTVYLRDIIESAKFTAAKSRLSFALGKDIGGDCIVGNISKLPHMLIAGTTGSGKSVCMNSLILSLLYKARPDEVRLIMIDPKMVELGVYNGIPHLYVPVVTDPKKAAGALQWSVVEMLKRYRMFSEVGVRDLENYNRHCVAAGESAMPQIVIVIDELADLMLVASKEVEESICRVAQMGRAAGMHLIIATQRPSADVITGLMKANIPSRIAFAVSSAMESRIILDQAGAEKLVGMGDMLFSPVGCGKPTRIQGAFVSDEEREDVIQFIKESSAAVQQNSEIEVFMNKAAEDKSSHDNGKAAKEDDPAADFDEMLPQAVKAVLDMKSCSVSMLQRRIKLGYSRAARIVDQMEELGIVGPYEGAKPRQVIIDAAGWHDIQVKLGLIEADDMPESVFNGIEDGGLDFD